MDIDAFGHQLRQLAAKVEGLGSEAIEKLVGRVADLEQVVTGLQERLDLLSQRDAPPADGEPGSEPKDDPNEIHEEGRKKSKKK